MDIKISSTEKICDDCDFIFPVKSLTYYPGQPKGKSLCEKCAALRNYQNKSEDRVYARPLKEDSND